MVAEVREWIWGYLLEWQGARKRRVAWCARLAFLYDENGNPLPDFGIRQWVWPTQRAARHYAHRSSHLRALFDYDNLPVFYAGPL